MSLILSGTDGLSDVDGTAATPAIRGTDSNTGIFFGSDIIGFAEGGAEVARFNADAQFVAAAGTALLPVITTTGDVNTGIFFPAADTIAFAEGGAEAMRIDSSGNVGIGSSGPSSSLTIQRASAAASLGLRHSASGNGYGFNFNTTGTTANDLIINSEFNGSNTERMRINSVGQIAWGTSSIDGYLTLTWAGQTYVGFVMNNTDAVGTSANIRFKNNGTLVGEISSSTTTTNYVTSSDYRLKENVVPMTGALATVSALKPVTYKWKLDGADGQGFIAHELQEVAPYAVSGEKDGKEMQGVDYGKITPLLTAALQEALAKIESLEARLFTLESK